MNIEVSIILLNYNWKKFNTDCINSILRQTYKFYEIIFVDNNSTDGSTEEVEEIFKEQIEKWLIKIRKNNDNLRFAWWNNSWVEISSNEAKYIWLLNNDTIIDEDCLEKLIIWIKSDDKLWAVSSLILDKWSEKQIQKMTENWMVRITNAFWLQAWENAEIKNNIYYTNFLCWCSFLYKKNLVEQPFFDFYKIYAEDLQLSREIILKWYKLWICRDSIVHHFWSATMNKAPYTKVFLDTRNLMIDYNAFFCKTTKIKLFIPYILFHFLQLISNYSNFRNVFKAKWNAFLWIMNNKKYLNIVRTRVNNGRCISEMEFLSQMSCKMASDDFHSWKFKMLLIDGLNVLNKIYYKILRIPSIS